MLHLALGFVCNFGVDISPRECLTCHRLHLLNICPACCCFNRLVCVCMVHLCLFVFINNIGWRAVSGWWVGLRYCRFIYKVFLYFAWSLFRLVLSSACGFEQKLFISVVNINIVCYYYYYCCYYIGVHYLCNSRNCLDIYRSDKYCWVAPRILCVTEVPRLYFTLMPRMRCVESFHIRAAFRLMQNECNLFQLLRALHNMLHMGMFRIAGFRNLVRLKPASKEGGLGFLWNCASWIPEIPPLVKIWAVKISTFAGLRISSRGQFDVSGLWIVRRVGFGRITDFNKSIGKSEYYTPFNHS